jgi:hypothetical protein
MTDDLLPYWLRSRRGGAWMWDEARQSKGLTEDGVVSSKTSQSAICSNSLPPALLRKSSDDTRAQQPQGGKSRNPECPVDYARIAWCASTPIPLNTGMPFCPALSRSLPSQPSSLGLSNSKCQTAGALMLHEQIRPVLCLHTGIVSVRTVGAILHSPAGPSRHHI